MEIKKQIKLGYKIRKEDHYNQQVFSRRGSFKRIGITFNNNKLFKFSQDFSQLTKNLLEVKGLLVQEIPEWLSTLT